MPNFINAPTELAGLHTWLRADQQVSVDGSQLVDQWSDLSGNGHHFVQATPANKPLLVANAVNGKPAVRGDGVNDSLSNTAFSWPTLNTSFFVFKSIGSADRGLLVSNTTHAAYFANDVAIGVFRTAAGTGPQTPNLPVGAYHIGTVTFNGVVCSQSVDGASRGSLASTGITTGTVDCQLFSDVGLARYGNNEIAEFIVYSRVLTPGEITMVERYLARRYAISAQARVPLFAASDISGLVGWYKAGQGLGFEAGTNKIAVWNDLSGLDHHLLQATSGKRPTLTDGPIGRPAVLFDGVDDYMQASFTLAQPETIVIAFTHVNSISNYFWDGTSNARMSIIALSSTQYRMYSATFGGILNSSAVPTIVLGIPRILSCQYNAAASLLRLNGTQYASGTLNESSLPANGFTLGDSGATGSPASIAVAEVALYNRALATAEMQRLERAMGNAYGIAVA